MDTHIWLWMLTEPDRLASTTRHLVEDSAEVLFLSAASAWEISIKYGIGKLDLPEPPRTYIPDRVRRSGVTPLAVEHDHATRVADLPDHHRDPFDRLLVAQAQALRIPVITADRQLTAYDVETVMA